MPFGIGGPQYGFRDCKVGTWDGDGTYSNISDVMSAQLLSVSPQVTASDLEGDDAITATAQRTQKATVKLRMGGADTDVLSLITGQENIDSGSGGTASKTMRFTNRRSSYIGVVGQALAEEGDGDTHMFIPKGKIVEPFELKFEINGWMIPELTLTAVVDDNFFDSDGNPMFFDLIEHATARAVALPPSYS